MAIHEQQTALVHHCQIYHSHDMDIRIIAPRSFLIVVTTELRLGFSGALQYMTRDLVADEYPPDTYSGITLVVLVYRAYVELTPKILRIHLVFPVYFSKSLFRNV